MRPAHALFDMRLHLVEQVHVHQAEAEADMGDLLDRARLGQLLGRPDMLPSAPLVEPDGHRAGRIGPPG